MIEILKYFPDNIVAIHASGKITAKDYQDTIMPAANAIFERHEKAWAGEWIIKEG